MLSLFCPPPFYPTVLTVYKRASKVGISRLTSKDTGREMYQSYYALHIFVSCSKLLIFSISCARLKSFVRCPLYPQAYCWTSLMGGLLIAKCCRGLTQSNAIGLVVPQQHFILWYNLICCSFVKYHVTQQLCLVLLRKCLSLLKIWMHFVLMLCIFWYTVRQMKHIFIS